MDYKLRDRIKTVLQECYSVDLASDRGREYIADILVNNLTEGEDGSLQFKNYNGELDIPIGRVVENEEDYLELQKKTYEDQKKRNEELTKIRTNNEKLERERTRRLDKRQRITDEMTPEKKKFLEQHARQNIMEKNQHLFEQEPVQEKAEVKPFEQEPVQEKAEVKPKSQQNTPQPESSPTPSTKEIRNKDTIETGITITDDMSPDARAKAERLNKMIADRKAGGSPKKVSNTVPKNPVKKRVPPGGVSSKLKSEKSLETRQRKGSFKGLGKKSPRKIVDGE